RCNAQAASELRSLVEQAPPPIVHPTQVECATSLYRERKRDDAQHLFDTVSRSADSDSDSRAQALYFLAEIARDKDDRDRNGEIISQLRILAPQSTWLQQALLSSGIMYLLQKDYEKAVRAYS